MPKKKLDLNKLAKLEGLPSRKGFKWKHLNIKHMKPKTGRHYIYVARDSNYYMSFCEFDVLDKNTAINFCKCLKSDKPFYGIKLKKGEQKRHPIDDYKWEKV